MNNISPVVEKFLSREWKFSSTDERMTKGGGFPQMGTRDFYPFVEQGEGENNPSLLVSAGQIIQARIAVYDDQTTAPHVVLVEQTDVRSFLAEVTKQVNDLSHKQGGTIPFTVIRELVENYIHARLADTTVTILDGGNTIRFSDQGPGIADKELALEYGTSSATPEMKMYIRGTGSGLPLAQQYMYDKGGTLTIEDNINGGTVVTISTVKTPKNIKPSRKEESPSQSVPPIQISDRYQNVLDYLADHESVGPTDLVKAYGSSQATWSRELRSMEEAGLIRKDGQKRRITATGQAYL